MWDFANRGIPDHLQTICGQLNSHGYQCTYKAKNSEFDKTITLEDYRNWNKFGVITMITHGGVSGGEVHFNTGVLVRDVPDRYNKDFVVGNLLPANYQSWPDMVTAITPGWFTTYYGPSGFDRTLLYIAGCAILTNKTLSSVLIGNGGTSTVFSWDNKVELRTHATDAGIDLFTQLLTNKRDCGEAHLQVDLNGNAEVQNPPAKFLYEGNPWLRLIPAWIVVSTNPKDGAANVPVTTPIAAAFSTDVDPATVNSSTFLINPRVAGSVSYQNRTAGFFPTSDLEWNTTYTATITTGVEDFAGNSLDDNYSWTFKTAAKPDNNCVDVKEGPWTFCVEGTGGECVLEFVGGDLTQRDCYVSYDDDAIFAGDVTGNYWSGENPREKIAFYGFFNGNPADSFEGFIETTDGSGVTAPLTGHYGRSARPGRVAGIGKQSTTGVTTRDLRNTLKEMAKRSTSK
jgi:hypothetical protein